MTPTTEPAKRIARLFNRRPTTSWSEREIRAYRKLVKDGSLVLDDLSLIERYYFSERKKGENGIHRRDLCTFLNNFPGELDRAKAWEERVREQKKRVVKRYVETDGKRPCTDEEFAELGRLARIELEKLRIQFGKVPKP
jgi:hypothetical protein